MRRGKSKYSPHTRARIIILWRDGATYSEIADSLGLAANQIAYLVRRLTLAGLLVHRQLHGTAPRRKVQTVKAMRSLILAYLSAGQKNFTFPPADLRAKALLTSNFADSLFDRALAGLMEAGIVIEYPNGRLGPDPALPVDVQEILERGGRHAQTRSRRKGRTRPTDRRGCAPATGYRSCEAAPRRRRNERPSEAADRAAAPARVAG